MIAARSSSSFSMYYSPATSNVFIPLSLIYTCVAHLWLYLRHGRSWRDTLVSELPPPSTFNNTDDNTDDNNDCCNRRCRPKIAIVTGANTGIGLQTAQTLVVQYGYHVILACRSKDKALQAQQQISTIAASATTTAAATTSTNVGRAIVLDAVLDLSDVTSIQEFVQEVDQTYGDNGGIDVLINNAGRNTTGELLTTKAKATTTKNPATANDSSLDLMFVSNYLGHFLLTRLLLESNLLKRDETNDTDQPKIILNVSSVMHHFISSDDDGTNRFASPSSNDHSQYQYWKSRAHFRSAQTLPDVYSATKLAAILHAMELNRRYSQSHGIYAMAVNPGAVNSDIWRGFPNWIRAVFRQVYLTTQQGSAPLVAGAVLGDEWRKRNVLYLQPYWNPSPSQSTTTDNTPMLPFTEMLGPYIGFAPTTARLPHNDGGLESAAILWQVSDDLVENVWVGSNE
ncbi:short-chain dehydrogenase/reductase SDR [Nitzschia inconspicua]|uniref:Short-chain dehydrogenase/reductase SDR n=1 Tax=Nitzschia inconspicua TaxID=303405 RepID=A0A9K3KLI9_9STRA|nr:short-chain dehydrogenase/reductase SDR [Nitzschia inconspicua]